MNKALLYRDIVDVPVEFWSEELDLLKRHDIFFESRLADTDALVRKAHEIRYQVYCLERKFENVNEHSNGLEVDSYDSRSVQGILFHRPTNEGIGTVRMVFPTPDSTVGLPVGQLLADHGVNLSEYLPIENTVEVSRFAISKSYRRRNSDNENLSSFGKPTRSERVRNGNLPCLSLVQFLVRQSKANGVDYWAAVMEVKLLRMLDNLGIHFRPVGPIVMHHGLRQPCFCNVDEMLHVMKQEQPDYWKVVTG